MNAVLGDMEEIRKAQQKLDEVQAALREAEQREQESKQAKRELEAALAEVKSQEDARNNKTAELQKKTEEGGLVSRNKAKAELAQHLAEVILFVKLDRILMNWQDPLPLRRAKITLEAAVKKAEKAAIAAEAAAEGMLTPYFLYQPFFINMMVHFKVAEHDNVDNHISR